MSIRAGFLFTFFSLAALVASYTLSGNSAVVGGKMRPVENELGPAGYAGWNDDEYISHSLLNAHIPDTTELEFVNYSINGIPVSIGTTTVGRIIQSSDDIYLNSILVEATGGAGGADFIFRFNNEQVVVGGNRPLYHVMNGVIGFPLMPDSAIAVYITEYGNPGEFISGHFSGTVRKFTSPDLVYTISCAFRVRRQF